MPTPLARRGVLTGVMGAAFGALAVTTLGGCDAIPGLRDGGVPPPGADEFEPLLASERALLAGYDAVTARFPELAGRLQPLRADHAGHVQALRTRLDPRRLQAVPSSVPPPPAVGAFSGAALAALVAAERGAAARFTAACLASSGERAALLASISASETSHLVVLE